MEARRDTDVQIVRQIWVQGRKTHRTIQQLVPPEVSRRKAETPIVLPGKANDQRCWRSKSFRLFSNSQWAKRPSLIQPKRLKGHNIMGFQVGHFWQAELAMRVEPNVVLRCRNLCSQITKRCQSIQTAGRWPWKSASAKECVTTHLPNGLALKMDGAQAQYLYTTKCLQMDICVGGRAGLAEKPKRELGWSSLQC
ncbi:MAG: hypothetical protein EZS28_006851 [Streblomastix strix]|uniref:Uncharacterized protein n=1 Tax=Streblomastix strix TaxID=222440 RepID=A0A5J4WRA7_9EUKA|nr:MAG: hypothetical protein EZS28_006851 [Streblomastix strix]